MKTNPNIPTETDDQLVAKCDPGVRRARRIELAIVHRLIADLHAAGYDVCVDDGGEQETEGDEQQMITAVFSVDDCRLITTKDRKGSFVYLVAGNGADIISDYSTSLEQVIAPIYDWIEGQQDGGHF